MSAQIDISVKKATNNVSFSQQTHKITNVVSTRFWLLILSWWDEPIYVTPLPFQEYSSIPHLKNYVFNKKMQ